MKELIFEDTNCICGGVGAPATTANNAGTMVIAGALVGIPGGPAGVVTGAILGGLGAALPTPVPIQAPAQNMNPPWKPHMDPIAQGACKKGCRY